MRDGGLLAAAGLAALLSTAGVAAQETVRSARLLADFTEGGREAEVTVEYVVEGVTGAPLPLELLRFGSARVEALRVEEPAGALTLGDAPRGRRMVGEVTLDEAPEDGTARLRLRYRLRGLLTDDGGDFRAHVPLLVLARPPGEAMPGLFHAEVRVPARWRLSEAFPTGLEGGEAAAGVRGYEVDLQVVPSVVSFRGRADGTWRPGLPLVLDLGAGLLLLAFAVVGARHLRSEGRA